MDKVIANTEVVSSYRNCAQCGRNLNHDREFAFRVNPASSSDRLELAPRETIKCFWCTVRHIPMLRRSLLAAVVVGTALTILNQGDLLLSGQWHHALFWKIPLTYCIPFCVATFGALANSRQ